MVAPRSQQAVRPRRAGESRQARTSIRTTRPRRSSSDGSQSLPEAERARANGLLHRHPPARRQRLHASCPTTSSTRASWRTPRRCCARRPRSPTEPTLKTFLDEARRRVSVERLLRQRRRVDGAEGRDRADHRPVRGLRGRVVQLQGRRSSRSSPCRTKRRRAKLQKFAGELQDIENHLPIDPKYRNPKLGALAPIVVVNEIFAAGDAQPRRADRRVQPAERRARRRAKRAPSA